jgi:hypothetical protein
VLRIRIRIRMNPYDFGLLADADADPGYVKKAPMIKKKLKFLNNSLVYFKGKVQREFNSVF